MKLLFTGILICFSVICFGQTKGEVIVVKDPLIDTLIAKRITLSREKSSSGSTAGKKSGPIISITGYRVQIFYGSDRREMYSEQARFKAEYPKLNTYVTYTEPNYYLRVGDFRSHLEAQRFLNELRPSFPTLFIFREIINAQNLDYNNDN